MTKEVKKITLREVTGNLLVMARQVGKELLDLMPEREKEIQNIVQKFIESIQTSLDILRHGTRHDLFGNSLFTAEEKHLGSILALVKASVEINIGMPNKDGRTTFQGLLQGDYLPKNNDQQLAIFFTYLMKWKLEKLLER